MLKPKLTVRTVTDGSIKAAKNISGLKDLAVYVGIPESDEARQDVALGKAAKMKGRGKRFKRLMGAAQGTISNAELAFIHTHGARLTGVEHLWYSGRVTPREAATQLYLHSRGGMAMAIPPRPIIEPAIEADADKILPELREAASLQLDGKRAQAVSYMKRAGMAGQNAAKGWFTDPRNHWAPNAPSTIRRKGSSRPLIDTGVLRNSIVYVLGEKAK